MRQASATWTRGTGGGSPQKVGTEEGEVESGKTVITHAGDKWVLVGRVEEPLGVVLWPPGPFPVMEWADIPQV